jgi:hypothetical protein
MISSVLRTMIIAAFVTALVFNEGLQAQVPGPVGEPPRGARSQTLPPPRFYDERGKEIPDRNAAPSGEIPTNVIATVGSLLAILLLALVVVMRQKHMKEQTEKQLEKTQQELEQTRQELQKREEAGPRQTNP